MIFYVAALMLVSATLCSAQTTYLNCTSSGTPIAVAKVNVPGCTTPPCKLVRGKDAQMTLYLDFLEAEATVYNKVEAHIGTTWINYPLSKNDGCSLGLHCPEPKGAHDTMTLNLTIPGFAPTIETEIRWTLWLDSDLSKTQLDCIELEVQITS